MNEIGMNDETKKLYHQYLEAKATIDDLEKKISLIRPYYERTKAIYDNARLAELKSMDYQTYLKTDEWQRKRLDAIETPGASVKGAALELVFKYIIRHTRGAAKSCRRI